MTLHSTHYTLQTIKSRHHSSASSTEPVMPEIITGSVELAELLQCLYLFTKNRGHVVWHVRSRRLLREPQNLLYLAFTGKSNAGLCNVIDGPCLILEFIIDEICRCRPKDISIFRFWRFVLKFYIHAHF